MTNPKLSLICFGGKGGVGKTTSAAATAVYLADKYPQKRILLASVDPAHSVRDCLYGMRNYKNLKIWEIDARVSFRKFIALHSNALKKIIERGTFLDETDITDLFSISMPGIDELMGMTELADLLESGAHDVIVLDTAPTGHTIKFLQIPYLIRRWTHVFDLMMEKHRYLSKLYLRRYQPDDADAFINALAGNAKKIERILQRKSCEFVPVVLPEILSVNETGRFLTILKKHKIQVNNIIINRVYPDSHCAFCKGQYALQKRHIDVMGKRFEGYNLIRIPLYKDEVHGKGPLLSFAQAIKKEESNLMFRNFNVAGGTDKESLSVFNLKKAVPEDSSRKFIPQSDETRRLPIPGPLIEFMLFSGKGGVGKTTLSSATALTLSDIYAQKRILLFSTDPAHSLSDCLGVAIGDEGLLLKKNLYVLEMDAEKEYEKLKQLYSEEISGLFTAFIKKDNAVNIVFEKEIMESLMDITPPGIDEVMAVARIIDYMDKGTFDIFVLDTAPTGHLIRFLEMPELALEWLRFFFNLFLKYKNVFSMPRLSAFMVDLSKKIKRLLALLRDGGRAIFIPVTILTEMAREETSDLVEAVKRLKIPVSGIILNMAQPYTHENIAADGCFICRNRALYEEKMFNVFKGHFPAESMHIVYKEEKEMVGVEALQDLGRKLYGVNQV